MGLRNLVGFESGIVTANIETGFTTGTASIQSSIKRSGNYALRANPTTTGTGYADIRDQSVDFNKELDIATAYYRFWFRPETIPAANSEEFAAVLTATAYKMSLRITSAG